MNTTYTAPIRKSARIAAATMAVQKPTVTSPQNRTVNTPVKTRHSDISDGNVITKEASLRRSRRLALRSRPNYTEAAEWEVEDPIYPSNTEFRSIHQLSIPKYNAAMEDVKRVKDALDRSENSIHSGSRRNGVIDSFYWSRTSEFMIPMHPKYRAAMRDKIKELEKNMADGKYSFLAEGERMRIMEEFYLTKNALANAHRSPWYVAAEGG